MKNENNYLTHGIHPYHAKFIPDIPKEFLMKYTEKNNLILDPFCGSGTTLLECMLNERRSVGVDMNEIAYRITLAKTFVPDIKKLQLYFNDLMAEFDECNSYIKTQFPDKDIWYSKESSETLDKLLFLINKIDDALYKNIFLVIFSSIVKTVSNKRETWNNGYIADNILPNKEYKGNSLDVFVKRCNEAIKSYEELLNKKINKKYYPLVYNNDINKYSTRKKFDAIITSPPYPFAVDFVKYNRLSFYWLGLDVESSAEKETGARTKRSRKNAKYDFFIEMKQIYLHLFSMVKNGGYFCMTVANTKRKNETVDFVEWLDSIFLENGWVNVQKDIRKLQNQSMAQKRISEEIKLVYRKK